MSAFDDADASDVRSSAAYRQDLRERLRQREQRLVDLIRSSQVTSRNNGNFRSESRAAGSAGGGFGAGESNRLLDLSRREGRSAGYVDNESDDFEVVGGRGSSDVSFRDGPRRSTRDEFRSSNGDVRARLEGIERSSKQQSGRIRALEGELSARNAEVDALRDELVKRLEEIVTLELIVDRTLEGGSEVEPSDLEAANKLTPRQAQVFFAQLLGDLRDLEDLYKDERLKSGALQDQLRLENEFMRTEVSKKVSSLNDRLERADDERRRLASALVDRDMELQDLKRTLADLRLRAVITETGNGDDDVFDDLDRDQLEGQSTNRRRVRREQEEAVERARRMSTSIGRQSERSRPTARFDDRSVANDEVDIDSVISDPILMSGGPRSSSFRRLGDRASGDNRKSLSPSRRQSARYLDERNPVFAERVTSYDDEDTVDFERPGLTSSFRPPFPDPSLSPSRRKVLEEQQLAIERAKSSSSLRGRTASPKLSVRTVPFEEPLVESNGDGVGDVPGTTSSSAADRSRRAVQRDQQRNIQRAKRGGFFSRLTRIGRAQLVEF